MRLNKSIKEKIINNAVVKSGILTEAAALMEERAEIAEKIRRTFISEEDENCIVNQLSEIRKKIKECGLEPIRVRINSNGRRLALNFNGYIPALWFHDSMSLPDNVYKMSRYGDLVVKDDFGAFENEEKSDALIERYRDLKIEINARLQKCTTDKQLLKLWPESAEIIPQEVLNESKDLMVSNTQLNKLLGLPTE